MAKRKSKNLTDDFTQELISSLNKEHGSKIAYNLKTDLSPTHVKRWISTGSKTAEFEQKFAEYIGVKHAIAVSSCTAALHLSLVAAGIESGDEIINPIHLLLQQKQSAMLMQFRYLWI